MTADRTARLSRLLAWVPWVAIGLLVIVFWLQHLELALDKHYNIDEYQYAHGAWRIAQGEVIYRDFFEHHFPLIHQLMAGVFLVVGDEDPGNLLWLRLFMLPFLTLTLIAAAGVNAWHCGRLSLMTPLMVLMVPTFSVMATEVRPDPLAFSLFLSALAVLYLDRLSGKWRGFLSGVLLVAATWGTLKVAYYGLIFPAAWVADLLAARQGRREFLLGHPFGFMAGAAAGCLPIALYLTFTGSWGVWFEWCIQWSFVHQYHYPGFFWTRNFVPLLTQSFWLFPLAICGVVSTVRAEPSRTSPDWLLLGALVTTLGSFAWQSAAYLYSLVPFTVLLCVFAGRGFSAIFESTWKVRGAGVFAAALLVLITIVEVQRSRGGIQKLLLRTNASQHALLSRVHQLTRPDEPVLNIAGGQITRPSVHFFYFFEAVVRKLKSDVFAYELPKSLVEEGCVAYMPSDRFGRLPEPLRLFLLENFQAHDKELWFWGRRYEVPDGGELRASFVASRKGRYFVWPLGAPRIGELTLSGQRLTSPIVPLEAGSHGLTYRGEDSELFLVWLPANGEPFEPKPGVKPGVDGF